MGFILWLLDKLKYGLFVGLVGTSITFVIMVALICLIYLTQYIIVNVTGENKNKNIIEKQANEKEISPEIIAVISAAISSYYGEYNKETAHKANFVVRSIRKRI